MSDPYEDHEEASVSNQYGSRPNDSQGPQKRKRSLDAQRNRDHDSKRPRSKIDSYRPRREVPQHGSASRATSKSPLHGTTDPIVLSHAAGTLGTRGSTNNGSSTRFAAPARPSSTPKPKGSPSQVRRCASKSHIGSSVARSTASAASSRRGLAPEPHNRSEFSLGMIVRASIHQTALNRKARKDYKNVQGAAALIMSEPHLLFIVRIIELHKIVGLVVESNHDRGPEKMPDWRKKHGFMLRNPDDEPLQNILGHDPVTVRMKEDGVRVTSHMDVTNFESVDMREAIKCDLGHADVDDTLRVVRAFLDAQTNDYAASHQYEGFADSDSLEDTEKRELKRSLLEEQNGTRDLQKRIDELELLLADERVRHALGYQHGSEQQEDIERP